MAFLERLRTRDPHFYAVRRAARAAVVVPVAFAIGAEAVGNAQVATFAAFGSFALLLFVEFPGGRASRAACYGALAATGAALIALGTVLSEPTWLAVGSMAVVGFLVLFTGAISSILAAGGRAALLAFILPVMINGHAADIPARLLGWAVACAVAIPAALFVWPPQDQNQLRVRAAAACHSIAHLLEPRPVQSPPLPDAAPTATAIADLRAAFRASAARPVALSTGRRLLVRLVDELEWLATTVAATCAATPTTWSAEAQRLRMAATEALHACAYVLDHDGDAPEAARCARLDERRAALRDARRAVSLETLDELRAATDGGGNFDRPLYTAHELGYVVDRTAATVAFIAAADSRGFLDRLLGRPAGPDVNSEAVAAERIAAIHLDRRSVWWQNSVRAAAGLAGAVLVARVSGQSEGFWIVLGALSVLRSNALSTGATALRAVAGTAVGFLAGALLVLAVGTSPAVLWPLLPVAVFVAAYTPEVISFAAGQAAFTLVVIVLFNIIAPAGWVIGVLRIEDVALGCATAAFAGLLFWPRGAGAALGRALSDAYRQGADHVAQAVDYVTGRRPDPPDAEIGARAADLRLDAAFRQYLADRGPKRLPLASVTLLTNGATRLRLAGEAISDLRPEAADAGDRVLAPTVSLLVDEANHVTNWYRTLGGVLSGATPTLPRVDPLAAEVSFLDVVLPAVHGCGDPSRAAHAERLLWSGQYLADVNRMREDLVTPAGEMNL